MLNGMYTLIINRPVYLGLHFESLSILYELLFSSIYVYVRIGIAGTVHLKYFSKLVVGSLAPMFVR